LTDALDPHEVQVDERPTGFSIRLRVRACDAYDAGLRASRLLGDAWERAGRQGRPGVDYDLTRLGSDPR
jgi:hypothetical protein